MPLDARLTRLEHREEIAALARPGLVDGEHVPVAGIRCALRELGSTVGDGPLLNQRIGERDRCALVGHGAGRRRQRRADVRKADVGGHDDAARERHAAGRRERGRSMDRHETPPSIRVTRVSRAEAGRRPPRPPDGGVLSSARNLPDKAR